MKRQDFLDPIEVVFSLGILSLTARGTRRDAVETMPPRCSFNSFTPRGAVQQQVNEALRNARLQSPQLQPQQLRPQVAAYYQPQFAQLHAAAAEEKAAALALAEQGKGPPPTSAATGTASTAAASAASASVAAASSSAQPSLNGRIIFLDVDGVLHPTTNANFFLPRSMMSLRQIVEQTGAAIVLSSFWQATPAGRQQVNEALRNWGIPAFIACTVTAGDPGSGPMRRAMEIASWVKAFPHLCARGWVALDDLDLRQIGPPPAFQQIIPPQRHVCLIAC